MFGETSSEAALFRVGDDFEESKPQSSISQQSEVAGYELKAWKRSWRTVEPKSGGYRTSRLVLVLAVLIGACGGDSTAPEPPRSFNVLSESFNEGEQLPARFTCDGADISPSIGWEDPGPTASYALTMTDEDADGFVHWAVLGIPGSVENFPDGAPPSAATEGANDFGSEGYRGPCPPPTDPAHTYTFTIYALNRSSDFFNGTAAGDLGEGFTASQMLDAIGCCVEAKGEASVRYDR